MGSVNKGRWYKLLIDKMDQAIINKYYFEAIFIEYMLIDDRLKTLANLAGIELTYSDGRPKMMEQLIDELKDAKNRQTNTKWKLLDTCIPLAETELLKAMKKEKYPIEKIYDCTHVPRVIINYENSSKSGKYHSKYGDVNASFLKQIQEWSGMRNHWMHAAGNDCLSLEEYESDITPLAIDGNSLARELCDITNRIKRGIQQERKINQKENG